MLVFDPSGPKVEVRGRGEETPLQWMTINSCNWTQIIASCKKSASLLKNKKNYFLKLLSAIQAVYKHLWPEIDLDQLLFNKFLISMARPIIWYAACLCLFMTPGAQNGRGVKEPHPPWMMMNFFTGTKWLCAQNQPYLKNGKNYFLKLWIKIQADFWQLWPEIAIQIKYILSKSWFRPRHIIWYATCLCLFLTPQTS